MARRKAQTTVREILITLGLILAVIWLAYLAVGIFRKEQIARQAVTETRAELAALDARKKTLSGTVNELDTDRGQEASVRENFGVARPGEDVIVVVPKKEIAPPPHTTFWERVKEALIFWK